MTHFSKEYIDFFKGLTKNNNRKWFDSHKDIYEKYVKVPFQDFVEEMIILIHQEDPTINLNPKEAIFRIYRDIRFSKDKTPYKTHLSAAISSGGKKDMAGAGFYFEIGAEGANIYAGSYMPDKDNLLRIRNFITHNQSEFKKLISDKTFKKHYGNILGEKSKILPKDLKEAAENQPLIFNKQFYYHGKIDASKLTDKKFTDIMMKYYHACKPVSDFLEIAMKSF